MSDSSLQVPIKAIIRQKALKQAEDEGFSSLQELVRVFLTQYSKGNISLTLQTGTKDNYTTEQISEFDDLARKADEEYKRGDYIQVNSKADLMRILEANTIHDKPILYSPDN
jgi:hypothetical protein